MVEIRRTSSQRRKDIADRFADKVAKRELLRLKSIRHKDETVWFGLGMFGIVGWSVAIPTLIGIAVGLWIDRTWPSRYSWASTPRNNGSARSGRSRDQRRYR